LRYAAAGDQCSTLPATKGPTETSIYQPIQPARPCADGTAIRDYIHVMDLAEGHVAAVAKIQTAADYGCHAINLGTGRGTSVLEMVRVWEGVTGSKVKCEVSARLRFAGLRAANPRIAVARLVIQAAQQYSLHPQPN